MKILLLILLLPSIGFSQSNDFLFFEDSFWGRNVYYLSLDTISEKQLDVMLNPDNRKIKPEDFKLYYRFWLVKDNHVSQYFEFQDLTEFDYMAIKNLSKHVKYKNKTVLFQNKDSLIDSLRTTKTPFYFANASPNRKLMIDIEAYFKPEEFSPWNDPEMFFWLSDHKDSLMGLIDEAYSEIDLESIEFTAASGPYKKGCHIKMRFLLNNQFWRMAPLMDIGFYPILQSKVEERTYKIIIGTEQ